MAVCQHWDCDQVIRGDRFLCYDHYDDFRDGLVDQCPRCGKFKNAKYELCKPCESSLQRSAPTVRGPAGQQKVATRTPSTVRVEHERSWEKGDALASEWYVYILRIDEPERYYIGQTRDLEERLVEHNDGLTQSTRGKNPKLRYFERHTTRESAELREAELKQLVKDNPREIVKMTNRLRNFVEWIDKPPGKPKTTP